MIETGRMIGERPEQTITKVVEVANAIGASVDPVDSSIAQTTRTKNTTSSDRQILKEDCKNKYSDEQDEAEK